MSQVVEDGREVARISVNQIGSAIVLKTVGEIIIRTLEKRYWYVLRRLMRSVDARATVRRLHLERRQVRVVLAEAREKATLFLAQCRLGREEHSPADVQADPLVAGADARRLEGRAAFTAQRSVGDFGHVHSKT